ncbi:MAG: phospholipase D-like domain-containing protein [Pseudonocardiales bacterium]
MRKRVTGGGVTVQAIAGTHAVFFGLDLSAQARAQCLGFAIHREDHTEKEQYWLSGFKTFESVVPVPSPAAFYSSRDHPVQSFYWGDYTVKPGHRYTYRIVPRYSAPKNLVDKPGTEATIDITTGDPANGAHGIYFNRGVAASQAYENKFGASPGKLAPAKRAEAMTWLSRGLFEAVIAFIGQATSAKFALRAAVYEFTHPDVLAAFRQAKEAGADVEIVYHARADDTGDANREAIADEGLDPSILHPRTKAKIAHNKFIVLCRTSAAGALQPVSVWTGSTNLTEGGIFGHSNVGHAVRDAAVAQHYLDYWGQLADDPDTGSLRDWVDGNSTFDGTALGTQGVHPLVSPRHGLAVLQWYAQQFGTAAGAAQITGAFGLNAIFEDVLVGYSGNALHYVMLDRADNNQANWSADHKVIVAVGSEGGPAILTRWAKEGLTGFNVHVPYLHTKIALIDPLSADPTVITGSANFSPASTTDNDENMLVVRGDTDVADVYFTEFTRIFNHFYARYWAARLRKGDTDARQHSFLAETDAWQKPYFAAGNPKALQRHLFSSAVDGNVG